MTTRIAVPVAGNVLCAHFGHCETFVLFDVDPDSGAIVSRQDLTPPHHEPGVYPRWLAEQGVGVVISGGMGGRARDLFSANNIQVVVGVASEDPEAVVKTFLGGRLVVGENFCDH